MSRQLNAMHTGPRREDWETPPPLFAKYHAEFGFTLDAAASKKNAKVPAFFSRGSLSRRWPGVVWLNPPYGRGRRLAPLKKFERAKLLVERVALLGDMCGNSCQSSDGAAIRLRETQGQIGFGRLDSQIGSHHTQDNQGVVERAVPPPCDALVELSGLLTPYSPDAKCLCQELDRWPVRHLDFEDQVERRGVLLRATRRGEELPVDVNTPLAVNEASAIRERLDGNSCRFHEQILPRLRAVINRDLGKTPGIGLWVEKAFRESRLGSTVVCLVPARTDAGWWHDFGSHAEQRFIRGRIRFVGARYNAPFPSAVLIFRPGGLRAVA